MREKKTERSKWANQEHIYHNNTKDLDIEGDEFITAFVEQIVIEWQMNSGNKLLQLVSCASMKIDTVVSREMQFLDRLIEISTDSVN